MLLWCLISAAGAFVNSRVQSTHVPRPKKQRKQPPKVLNDLKKSGHDSIQNIRQATNLFGSPTQRISITPETPLNKRKSFLGNLTEKNYVLL